MNPVIINCIPITESFFKDSTRSRNPTYQDVLQNVCKIVYLAVQTTDNSVCKKTCSWGGGHTAPVAEKLETKGDRYEGGKKELLKLVMQSGNGSFRKAFLFCRPKSWLWHFPRWLTWPVSILRFVLFWLSSINYWVIHSFVKYQGELVFSLGNCLVQEAIPDICSLLKFCPLVPVSIFFLSCDYQLLLGAKPSLFSTPSVKIQEWLDNLLSG